MKKQRLWLVAGLLMSLIVTVGTVLAATRSEAPIVPAADFPVIADFESGAPPDWFVYNGGGSSLSASFVDVGGNTVVSATYSVGDFAGFGALLPSQDWSDYEGIRFDLYGSNSGAVYALEVQDGSAAVVERFQTFVADDFSGWQTIVVPFSAFVRGGFQEPGAPDDGFQLDTIKAWVFPLPLATGSVMLDNLVLVDLVPFADFDDGAPAGWFVYNGGGSSVSPAFVTVEDTDPYAVPGQVGSNGILSGTFNVTDFGGFGANFSPSQDWSALEGISFWFYGANTGATYTFEVQDGTDGNPVVERFQAFVVDDFSGWRHVALPWDTFVRGSFQEPGAPDDGLNLVDVRAWAFPLPSINGAIVMDAMSVYGDTGMITLTVQFDDTTATVAEGGTVSLTVSLNVVSAETITVSYATADGTANAGSDYNAASGTLTFDPGVTSLSVPVTALEDTDPEDAETFTVTLSDPIGADLGSRDVATVTIADNDSGGGGGKVDIVDDFDDGQLPSGLDPNGIGIGFVTWSDGSPVAIMTTTVDAAGIDPLPGGSGDNIVLQFDGTITSWGGFTHAFEDETVTNWINQDWSGYEGISFALYGNGSGTSLFVDILDNRNPDSTTDDAERWTYSFDDDFVGWKQVTVPFSEFTRKEIGNGAPNDGFNLDEVHGWALGSLTTSGPETHYIDNVGLVIRVTVIDDWNDGQLPSGTDPNGIGIGFQTFSDGSPVSIMTTTATAAGIDPVPGSDLDNPLLQLDATVNSFAGFSHAFEDEAVANWVNEDWSTYEGVCFWLYGQGEGTELFIDIIENRNPDSTTDDAERWTYSFDDDFVGWKFFTVPFSEFTRKEIGNGAPNDGFSRDEVHGWALGSLNSDGQEFHYIDDFAIYGNTGIGDEFLEVEFALSSFTVVEGDAAVLRAQLNMTATFPVTVTYYTAEASATPDRDYIPTSGTLIIPPDTLEATFEVMTLDDDKYENDESVIVVLTDPISATLGFVHRARLTIEDDQERDPFLIDDFETNVPFLNSTNVALTRVEVPDSSPRAVPGQGPYEHVIRGVISQPYVEARASRPFYEGQNWSTYDSLSFWYFGSNSGRDIAVELLDNQAADPGPANWVMVWSDEFNDPAGTPPNPEIWTHEIGDGTLNGIPGWGNSELQYYTDSTDNAATDGQGNLVITTRAVEEGEDLLCWYGPCEYTSARLISQNKIDFQYGRIEARIKVPSGGDGIPDEDGNDLGDGLWPAFWMLGDDIAEVGWPQTGEIDIMEVVTREPYEVFGTIHGPGYSGGISYGDTYTFADPVSDDFHVFGIEWEPNIIRWYVDGILYHTAEPSDVAPNDWVFEHPFFLLLNQAVGGNFGGPVGEDTGFPQSMVVDYVRVYQAPDTSERFEATFADSFFGWQQVSVPFSDLTRSATQPAGAPDDGLTLSEVYGYALRHPVAPLANASRIYGLDQVRAACSRTTVTVTTTDESGEGSLRDALEKVCEGGTIIFDLGGDETITVSAEIAVQRTVTIDGANSPGLVISGGGSSRVFVIDPGADLTLTNLTVADGYGWELAGGILNNGALTLQNVVVRDNFAEAAFADFWKGGAGIYNGSGGVLTIIDSTITNNTAAVIDGAGLYGFFDSTTIIENSTISNNVAGGVGGGMRSLGDVTVINSTFSGNEAQGWHGGAMFHTDGVVTFLNSTVASNVAPVDTTGGLFVGTFTDTSPDMTLTNSIVAYNSGTECFVGYFGAGLPELISGGHNVADDASCNLTATGDQPSTDPLLAALGHNGGPTQTHMPLEGSPAIDAGDAAACPTADQRGVARPQGAVCDSGAVEYAPVTITAAPVFTPVIIGAGGGSFGYNVTLTNNSSVAQTVDIWFAARLPNGSELPILNVNYTIAGGDTDTVMLTQSVPGAAPAGAYEFIVRAGTYATNVAAVDSFPVVKLGAAGNGPDAARPVRGWQLLTPWQ